MTVSTTAPALSGTWSLDLSHSAVEFVVKHMVISNVKGRFREFTFVGRGRGRCHQHRYSRRAARRSPALSRLLRRRDLSGSDLPQHRGPPARRRPLQDRRRPDDPRYHPADHPRRRATGCGEGPLGRHPGRLQRDGIPGSQGLRSDLEQHPRNRRPAGRRPGQAGARDRSHPQLGRGWGRNILAQQRRESKRTDRGRSVRFYLHFAVLPSSSALFVPTVHVMRRLPKHSGMRSRHGSAR
jgi:hypothetical protein